MKLIYLAVCMLAPQGMWGASQPLELKWNELAPMVSGHMVEVTLKEGRVKGEAITVREDTLLVQARSSSASGYSKGNAAIPRSAIVLIKVQRTGSTWGRALGTVVGVVAGLGLGGYSAVHTDSAGPGVAVLVGVTAGVAVLGYYIGKQVDRKETSIKIVP